MMKEARGGRRGTERHAKQSFDVENDTCKPWISERKARKRTGYGEPKAEHVAVGSAKCAVAQGAGAGGATEVAGGSVAADGVVVGDVGQALSTEMLCTKSARTRRGLRKIVQTIGKAIFFPAQEMRCHCARLKIGKFRKLILYRCFEREEVRHLGRKYR